MCAPAMAGAGSRVRIARQCAWKVLIGLRLRVLRVRRSQQESHRTGANRDQLARTSKQRYGQAVDESSEGRSKRSCHVGPSPLNRIATSRVSYRTVLTIEQWCRPGTAGGDARKSASILGMRVSDRWKGRDYVTNNDWG